MRSKLKTLWLVLGSTLLLLAGIAVPVQNGRAWNVNKSSKKEKIFYRRSRAAGPDAFWFWCHGPSCP